MVIVRFVGEKVDQMRKWIGVERSCAVGRRTEVGTCRGRAVLQMGRWKGLWRWSGPICNSKLKVWIPERARQPHDDELVGDLDWPRNGAEISASVPQDSGFGAATQPLVQGHSGAGAGRLEEELPVRALSPHHPHHRRRCRAEGCC